MTDAQSLRTAAADLERQLNREWRPEVRRVLFAKAGTLKAQAAELEALASITTETRTAQTARVQRDRAFAQLP
jgi:hypothetical protein